jgi:hypothetical protein
MSDLVDLRCPICFETYSDDYIPVIFKCSHTICRVCHNMMGPINSFSSQKRCPICRDTIAISLINHPILNIAKRIEIIDDEASNIHLVTNDEASNIHLVTNDEASNIHLVTNDEASNIHLVTNDENTILDLIISDRYEDLSPSELTRYGIIIDLDYILTVNYNNSLYRRIMSIAHLDNYYRLSQRRDIIRDMTQDHRFKQELQDIIETTCDDFLLAIYQECISFIRELSQHYHFYIFKRLLTTGHRVRITTYDTLNDDNMANLMKSGADVSISKCILMIQSRNSRCYTEASKYICKHMSELSDDNYKDILSYIKSNPYRHKNILRYFAVNIYRIPDKYRTEVIKYIYETGDRTIISRVSEVYTRTNQIQNTKHNSSPYRISGKYKDKVINYIYSTNDNDLISRISHIKGGSLKPIKNYNEFCFLLDGNNFKKREQDVAKYILDNRKLWKAYIKQYPKCMNKFSDSILTKILNHLIKRDVDIVELICANLDSNKSVVISDYGHISRIMKYENILRFVDENFYNKLKASMPNKLIDYLFTCKNSDIVAMIFSIIDDEKGAQCVNSWIYN